MSCIDRFSNLLHDLVLSKQGGVFKVLSVLGGYDELLISAPLILAASLAELAVGVDLVSQVRSQEFLLSLLRFQVHFNLIKCFLWTKVRFIVQLLVLELCVFALLLFSDLVLDELTVRLVLILAILLLKELHAVHVVHCRVELIFFALANLLHIADFISETVQGLLIHFANCFK